ncbi:MAG: formylmethanofuran dehydrogenase subunit B [Pseudomonadota bacterium]
MAKKDASGTWDEVPSPFCGIGTDDIKIQVDGTTLKVLENGCAVNTPGFETAITDKSPRVNGHLTDLADAAAKAAQILRNTSQPLVGGCATDVNGMRAALSLADRIGAVVDQMNFTVARRNFLVLQDSGWVNTTLAEVKNRCDLLLVVGTDLEPLFPRFFERYIWNTESMFIGDTSTRAVVFLGKAPSGSAANSPDGRAPQVLPCPDEDLPEVVAVLRALSKGALVRASSVGGIGLSELQMLAEKLKEARYSVVTWAAGALNFSQAELTVQALSEMIKDLNKHTRCSGLPLAGKEGDLTANQVCGWQTGYPARISFSRGYPEYDPYLYATDALIGNGEIDALLWVSAFNVTAVPPSADIPTVVVGRSGMRLDKEPDVFIPVGTPGIDHAGHAYRTDNVVAIRLKKLRDCGLPSVAEVLSAIEQAL